MNPEKTQENQIAMLNTMVAVKLAPSPIHGIGVFAIRDIEQGERIYANLLPEKWHLKYEHFNKLRPTVAEELLSRFPLIATGSAFLWPDVHFEAYMNHSETPNYHDGRALEFIGQGEEITENYRKINGAEFVFDFLKT